MELGQALLGEEAHDERNAHRVRNATGPLAKLGIVPVGVLALGRADQIAGPPEAALGLVGVDQFGDDVLHVVEDFELARERIRECGYGHG